MKVQKVSSSKFQRPRHTIGVLLPLLIITPLILLVFLGTAEADFTITYDLYGKNFFKPAAAGNTQTGDFLVAYLDPVQCTGPAPDWEVRATLRNSTGGVKTSGLAPLGACSYRALGRPAVAYSPQSDVFCVAAPTTPRTIGPFSVMVGFIKGDGTLVEPFHVYHILYADGYYEGSSGHGSLNVVYNSLLNEFVVSVQVTESGTNRTLAQRITPSGTEIGSPVEFESPGNILAYAPVGGTTPPGGRYLFKDGWGPKLLNANLEAICVTFRDDPHNPGNQICDGEYIELWYGDNDEWSGNNGESFHFDAAYGGVEGKKRFLMVYSDGNNSIPGSSEDCQDGTGVWGIFIDPERLYYQLNDTTDIIWTYPTPFPITRIPNENWTCNICNCSYQNVGEWKPRVTYVQGAGAFAVVWRETPEDCASLALSERYSHIRGAWVERYVEDGKYGNSYYGYPPENVVLTDIESGNCTAWYNCDSYENPAFPDVVPVGGGVAAAVWHEYYDPPPIGIPPIVNWPPRWSIRGDLFPALPPPPNDDRANAVLVEVGQHEGTLLRATNDGSSSCGSASPDVWYMFQGPGPGTLLVSTCGTNDYFGQDTGVDTVLSLHSPSDGAQLAGMCNDDWIQGNYSSACLTSDAGYARDSALKYGLSNGESVLIRIAPFGSSKTGPIVLNVAFEAAPDVDGDGYSPPEDCDDNDNTVYPGAPERCDGKDNDCDSSVDEGLTRATTCGVGECAGNTGIETCTNGVWGNDTCNPQEGAISEVCDGLDNDCDGSVDEGLTRATTCGVGECAGNTGIETCTNGVWGNDTCNPQEGAISEVCDNLDNDCDGSVDEGLTRATTCGVGECAGNTGIETCTSGVWGNDTCNPQEGAIFEVCDGLDNDCDGSVDEGLTRATTCGVGECAGNTGIEACTNGVWGNDTCNPQEGAISEVCDGLDNDCDGEIDEGVCFNTPEGVDVPVTDESGKVTATFGEVTQEGDTTFTIEPCGESPWEGFTLVPIGDPVCVGIETTADYDPVSGVMVCITYVPTDMTIEDEKKLVMYHCYDEGDDKVVCTTIPCEPMIPVDTVNKVVCGCTHSFSIFGVGIAEDLDGDGIPDVLDNCPDLYDPTNACDGCAADLDVDGDVDGSDLSVFAEAYGSLMGDSTFEPAADFDENGEIDEADLKVMTVGFGRTDCPLP